LFISALMVSIILLFFKTDVIPQGVPIIFAHGINDRTIPLNAIYSKASCGSEKIVKVIEIDDTHSLSKIIEKNFIIFLIKQVYDMKDIKVEIKEKNLNTREALLKGIKKN
jgi:hypothetical protein